jgi:isoprenylcysteine carboxyl methyltransferase (ICMT) family protein YpbQ
MPTYLIVFLLAAFAWRLTTVAISARNERALKANGAREYGTLVSMMLAGFHVAFYIAVVAEASMRQTVEMTTSYVGITLYLFSALALISVIRSLGSLWTIKLIIAPRHQVVRTGLFSFVRHPNYFVSIVPELLGLALATSAYWTICIGLPLYAIPLFLRIREEERVMRAIVTGYL